MKTTRFLKRLSPVIFLLLLFTFLFFVKFPQESSVMSYQFYQVLFHPVYQVSQRVSQAITGIWHGYLALVHVQQENDFLREEVKRVQGLETQVTQLDKEMERLRGLLELKPLMALKLGAAEVIALDMSADHNAFWINSGQQHGIVAAQPVIDHQGVIGQVYKVYPSRSLVLTLHDPMFSLHVVNARTDERAVLTGQTRQGWVRLRYVHREAQIQEGDLFMTSGLGGIFPQGIGVGTVVKVVRPATGLESEVWLKPLVDIERVQKVFTVAITAAGQP